MAQNLQAEVSAQFGVDGSRVNLSIENDPGATFVPLGDVPLLLFPAVDAFIATNVGTVRFGSNRAVNVPGGIVQISGGNETSLPKRGDAASPTLKVLHAFDTTGAPTGIGLSYDPATNIIRADKNCHAAISYTPYRTFARELIYRPVIDSSSSTYGVISAFYPPSSMTIFEVQPFGVDTGNSIFELYRIVSESVTTPDGEFEKPPGWPTSGAFPGNPIPALNPMIAAVFQRVHEIAQMDSTGRVWVETYFHPNLSPYQSDVAYKPVKRLVESNVPTSRGFSTDIILKAKNEVSRRGQGKL